jgi:hypothetical protein
MLIPFIVSFALSQSDEPLRRYYGISAGLGVTVINATDIVDFVNAQLQGYSRQDDFATAAEFFGDVEFQVNECWSAKLEYAYLLKSYNVPSPYGQDFVYSYNIHMPTAIVHYIVSGTGYIVQFGGGLGYHIARFTEDITSTSQSYHSSGLGVKLEIEANTAFDEHLFGYVGGDIRDDIMARFKDDAGNPLTILGSGSTVSMSFFSLGLKFGLSYFF